MQRFAIRRAKLELLIVIQSELARFGDTCACIGRDISGVDKLTAYVVSYRQAPCAFVSRLQYRRTDFCLKYKRPLATTARPDDASIGRRRNWTALLAILPILHDGGGGGDSDMLSTSVAGEVIDQCKMTKDAGAKQVEAE